MNNFAKPLTIIFLPMIFLLTSCFNDEDPGPLQSDERTYSIVDFDRLEIGSAMIITVEQGNFFSVQVRGDRRNLNDLDVFKDGNTLVARFDEQGNRSHDTYITITMPLLRSANFSGASNSKVSGFSLNDDRFGLYLSGASVCQLNGDFGEMKLVVSGASVFTLTGTGDELDAELSGASLLNAFDYDVDAANVEASGASKAKVSVNKELYAEASGASIIAYHGDPSVISNTSGGSSVIKD
ncbi:MAG TPA: head GIN domain-containing protein [Cyclobacteriaceae bacterium]|nr:head GIN domain-containing protein [Cyclobacteriaceae bacterium]